MRVLSYAQAASILAIVPLCGGPIARDLEHRPLDHRPRRGARASGLESRGSPCSCRSSSAAAAAPRACGMMFGSLASPAWAASDEHGGGGGSATCGCRRRRAGCRWARSSEGSRLLGRRDRRASSPRSASLHGLLPEGAHGTSLPDLRLDPRGRSPRPGDLPRRLRDEPAGHGWRASPSFAWALADLALLTRGRALGRSSVSPGRRGAARRRRGHGPGQLGLPGRRRPLTAVRGRRLYSRLVMTASERPHDLRRHPRSSTRRRTSTTCTAS